MTSLALDTPLAEALSTAVHSKIVDEGWTQEDDTSLAEYIVLMLANGKTQDQIASELAGELLQDAKGTTEFSQWLFDQMNTLSNGASTGGSANAQSMQGLSDADPSGGMVTESDGQGNNAIPAAYDDDMGATAPDDAPRGPKGLHGGRPAGRGGRGGIIGKNADSALHRTRGTDRINTHSRGVPKGPRNVQNQPLRPGMQKALNNMGGSGLAQGMQNPMMPNAMQQGQGMMPMSPQQQMEFMAMMEQQARMMAQFMPGMVQGGGMNQNFSNGQGRSLFDRVESGRGRGASRGRGRGGTQQNGAMKSPTKAGDNDQTTEAEGQSNDGSAMETDSTNQQRKSNEPSATMCHFNLRCTNKDCPYVHQSPVAPEGTVVDMSDICKFGAACKNPKCVGRHPSPAQIRAHQAEEFCKFFPNCSNPNCSFKHPTMPICSFGANCTNKECRFTHLQTPCRFNPCLNVKCPYKHEPGQAKKYADFTWTPDSAKQQTNEQDDKEHVSDRRFIAEDAGEEELIKPEPDTGMKMDSSSSGQAQTQEVTS